VKRIEGEGAGEDAGDGCGVVVGGLGELESLAVFDEAECPQRDDGEESEDGPTATSKGWFASAYFAVDEAEEGWGDESRK
jgi:hypothetical protein